MKNRLSISIILVLFMISTLLICNPASAEKKETFNRKSDISKRVEHRIDRLTMLIADKADEGVDTEEAENLLLLAIDLFDDKKIEESMEKLKEVERALGLEPLDFKGRRGEGMKGEFRGNNQQRGNFGFGPDQKHKPFMIVEMSESEKKAAVSEIKELLSTAQELIDEGKLEAAFEKLSDAHRMLADVTGMHPPFMGGGQGRMGPGGLGGFGPRSGFGPPQGFGPGGQGGPPFGQSMDNQQFQGPPKGKGFKRGQGPDIEKIFEKAREHGEEGFDKLSKKFDTLIDKLKGRGVDYETESEDYYHKAVKFRKNDDLESAFDNLEKAFELIRNSTNRAFSPGGPGMRGGPGKGQMRGEKMDSEKYKKMKNAAVPLHDVYQEYIEINERDEFIETCYDEFTEIRKKVMRGEIEVDDAVELIDALTKKIEENI